MRSMKRECEANSSSFTSTTRSSQATSKRLSPRFMIVLVDSSRIINTGSITIERSVGSIFVWKVCWSTNCASFGKNWTAASLILQVLS